jgi:hypothetical protein
MGSTKYLTTTESKQVNATLLKQVEHLHVAPMASGRAKYRELFGEEPHSKHRRCPRLAGLSSSREKRIIPHLAYHRRIVHS